MKFERVVCDVIEGRRKNLVLSWALKGAGHCYQAGVEWRHWAYDRGWFSTHRVSAVVISVGSIAAGGTGKTPFVRYLADRLAQKHKVAILTRGYRSLAEHQTHPVKVTPGARAEMVGDEPLWLSRELPQVSVWVGKRRRLSAEQALAHGAEVLLLDDGMQHRQLKRDIEIVTLNGKDLLGQGHFLPRGYLRDHPKRLKNADLIVIQDREEGAEELLRQWTDAPIVGVAQRLVTPMPQRVAAFCGIAKPERFLKAVGQQAEIVKSLVLADHRTLSVENLEQFAERAVRHGAEALVCTEKDRIKLPVHIELALPLIAVRAELEITSGHAYLESLMENIHHERKSQNHSA